MITARTSQATLDRDAIPSPTPRSEGLQHLSLEAMHPTTLNRRNESKRHDSPALGRKKGQQYSVPSLGDESKEEATFWVAPEATMTMPSFSASEPVSGRSFSPSFESKKEPSSSDSDSRSPSPYSTSSDDEETVSARQSFEEISWRDRYFNHAFEAIKNHDFKTLELVLGPEYYFGWLNYIRDKHNIRLPRLSAFYDYAIDFINQYEAKLEYDARIAPRHRDIFTPSRFNAEFLKNQRNVDELSKIYPGVADVAMHATTEALTKDDPLCRTYSRALLLYREKGIVHYSAAVKIIEAQLNALPFSVASKVLKKEKVADFEKQLDWHIESKLTAFISKVEENIRDEIDIMLRTKSRPSLGKKRYEDRYLKPYTDQCKEQWRAFRLQFDKAYEAMQWDCDIIQLKNKLIEIRNKLLCEEPQQLFKEKQEETLDSYEESANVLYKKKVDLASPLTVRILKGMDETYEITKDVKKEFFSDMIERRSKMGLDAFDRIKDEKCKNLLFYAIEHYNDCSAKEKEKLEPLIKLLLRHGCQMYSKHAFMDVETNTIKHYNVFEYIRLQDYSEPKLPDWPLLACTYEYMLTLSPFEEEVRVQTLNYCQMTHKDLTKWYKWYAWAFINLGIKEHRRDSVTQISFSLNRGQQYCGDIELIGKIAEKIFEISSNSKLKGIFRNSMLLDCLSSILQQKDQAPDKGRLIALPGTMEGLEQEANVQKVQTDLSKVNDVLAELKKEKDASAQERMRMQADMAEMRKMIESMMAAKEEERKAPPAIRVAHLLHTDRFAPPMVNSPTGVDSSDSPTLQRDPM